PPARPRRILPRARAPLLHRHLGPALRRRGAADVPRGRPARLSGDKVDLPGLTWLSSLSSGALSAPAALAVAAAGAGAIAAFYFLRLRRRRVVVAFAPLWLGAAGDPRASRRLQRLRHWLSLALALAIFAALW